jgi:hypothetical protein
MGAEFERLEIGFGVQTVMQEIKNQALAQLPTARLVHRN